MSNPPMGSEDELIAHFLRPLAAGFPGAHGLADDCAFAAPPAGHEFVLKTDAIAEGVHFPSGERPRDIGWKALAVNVSDLAAKGAVPFGYLMSLAFPAAPKRAWMAEFTAGLAEAQAAFGMHLLGGDTDRRPGPISITPTVIGIVATGKAVLRMNARPGDAIVVTGTLGDSALGLRLRLNPTLAAAWGLVPEQAEHLLARYARPQPRLGLRAGLLAYASASMDISDGIAKDLGRLVRASKVAARLEHDKLPRSSAFVAVSTRDQATAEAALLEGDDYEILATMGPANVDAFRAAALAAGIPTAIVGSIEAGAGLIMQDGRGRAIPFAGTGWDHF